MLEIRDLHARLSGRDVLRGVDLTLTPHIGWASDEAKQRLFEISLENFKNYLINN